MMSSLNHEVFLYASEDNEAECTELITIASKEDQQRWFGNYDYHNKFYPITWGGNEPVSYTHLDVYKRQVYHLW